MSSKVATWKNWMGQTPGIGGQGGCVAVGVGDAVVLVVLLLILVEELDEVGIFDELVARIVDSVDETDETGGGVEPVTLKTMLSIV